MNQERIKFKERIAKLGGNKAAIGRALGSVSGQLIGQYISGRQTPKEPFFKKWDKVYKEDIRWMFVSQEDIGETNVSRDTVSTGNNEESDDKALLRLLMQQMANLMKTQNNLLQEQKDQVVDRVKNIDSNLNLVLGAVIKINSDIDSSREVVLESLARLEKLPKGSLTGAANKIVKRRQLGEKK